MDWQLALCGRVALQHVCSKSCPFLSTSLWKKRNFWTHVSCCCIYWRFREQSCCVHSWAVASWSFDHEMSPPALLFTSCYLLLFSSRAVTSCSFGHEMSPPGLLFMSYHLLLFCPDRHSVHPLHAIKLIDQPLPHAAWLNFQEYFRRLLWVASNSIQGNSIALTAVAAYTHT